MDPATVYRNVRRSLTDFDERVVARYLDAEAPVRTSFRQLLRSLDDIAGIASPDGLALGLMNHPERSFDQTMQIFENGVAYAK